MVHLLVAVLGFVLPNWPMGDVTNVYDPWSRQALAGHGIVGLTEPWVYPQLALVPMVLAQFLTFFAGYEVAWAIFVTICDALVFALLVGRARSTGRWVAAWFWLAFIALLGPVGMYRLEGLTTALAIAGCLWLVGRPLLGAVLLAIATWMKVWPAALIGAAIIAVRGRLTVLAGAVLVSAVTLAGGKRVYLRSALVEGVYVSMQVVAEPWQRARLDLIASTMQWGRAPDLWPAPGGPLDRVLSGPQVPPPLPAPPEAVAMGHAPGAGPPARDEDDPRPVKAAPAAPAGGAGGVLLGTGTGFFVNNTDVVTAAHVVEGCPRLGLEDGAALAVIAADPVLDLAVLSSARRSDARLPLPEGRDPRLGQPVFALGFPYTSLPEIAGQGLAVTGGNVSALPRATGPAARVMISAPVQPGNSGGPLLAQDGSVLGVVVSRIADEYVLEATGTLPQNMNFVTAADQLSGFLHAARVLFPATGAAPARDLSDGVPEEVQAAVVLISCFRG